MSTAEVSSNDVEVEVQGDSGNNRNRRRVKGTTVVSSSRDDDYDETVSIGMCCCQLHSVIIPLFFVSRMMI